MAEQNITVNYDGQTGTYYLTDGTGAKIPGQELIDSATDATNRANALGTAKTDGVQSDLSTEKTAAANETASKTDTPPPANTGNNANTPAETKDAETPDDKNMTSAGTVGSKAEAESKKTILGPYANPLAKFPSYTYGIALWMMHPKDFNNISKNPKTWTPAYGSGVMVASGGKWATSGQYARLKEFNLDYFIDDLKFESSTPAAAKGKGATNQLSGTFTIIEPLGMSLVDNMAYAVHRLSDENGISATHTEIPYMLEIDFYGADENYVIQPKSLLDGNLKKRFPIKISNIVINFTNKGTEYAVSFVPFSHTVFEEDDRIVQAGKVENAQTVGEFFSGAGASIIDYYGTYDTEKKSIVPRTDLLVNIGAQNKAKILQQIAVANAIAKIEDQESQSKTAYDKAKTEDKQVEDNPNAPSSPSDGLAFVINTFNSELATTDKAKARKHPDFVKFVIHPDIAKAKIVNKADMDIKSIPMSVRAMSDTSLLSNTSGLKFDGSSYNISAGTSIVELVGTVMRNSEYIQDQLRTAKSPNSSKKANDSESGDSDSGGSSDKTKEDLYKKGFDWFKVIPSVKLGAWDEKVGRYQRLTTYYVVPYTVYNTNHQLAPQTVPKGNPFKQYDYFFTGKNTEIIECKLEFAASYLQLVSLGNQNKDLDSTEGSNADPEKPKGEYPGLNGYTDADGNFKSVPTAQPRKTKQIVNNQPVTTNMGGNKNEKTQIAADVGAAMSASADGNALTLRLRILGDPHYIKQDELLWNPGSEGYIDPMILPDRAMLNMGSLPFDTGEMYIDVNFKSPTDIDYKTGLVTPSLNSVKSSMFGGRFIITTIENLWSHGKFEQTLQLARYTDQEALPMIEAAQDAPRDTPKSSAPTPAAKAPATPKPPAATPAGASDTDINDIVFKYG